MSIKRSNFTLLNTTQVTLNSQCSIKLNFSSNFHQFTIKKVLKFQNLCKKRKNTNIIHAISLYTIKNLFYIEIYKDSLVDRNELDFENLIPYFNDSVARIRWIPYQIKQKFTRRQKKKIKFMINIITHLSALLSIIERREIKDLSIPENNLNSDTEVNYIRN